MYFDEDQDKRIFEDLQFKRQVTFVDDDSLPLIELRSYSKTREILDSRDRECQVNIQNEIVSSSTQTRSKKTREVQTESNEDTEVESKNADLHRINRLFEKRLGLLENAIEENFYSNAFKNYDVDWSMGGSTIINHLTLTYKQLVKDEESQIAAVEWNSSGSTIFCAYGRFDHESVCTHKAAFCSWNIDRLRLDPNKPDTVVETSCCVSAIAAHPEYPAICAVGFFNGDIHVYDIRQADPLVASVTDKNEMHRDEVTVIKWIKDPKSSKKKYLLLSGSRDGKILTWNALASKSQLKLMDGFILLVDDLPTGYSKSSGTEMGVSSIALNREDKETFMVGCDSGGLFNCSFDGKDMSNNREWERDFPVDLKSPVKLAYDPQHGPIYSISHSPFHRNLLLTCGTDSEIKLYSLLQTGSLMNFCPENGYLYSIEWSPFRPCVFACATHKGNILIYDLNELSSQAAFCQTIPAAAALADCPIYSLSFNARRADLLASGDKAGVVKIWRLSQSLVNYESSEIDTLNAISEKPFVNN